MPVGNETNHVLEGLTVRGGLAVAGNAGYLSDVWGNAHSEDLLNGHLPGVRTVRRNMPRGGAGILANLAIAAAGVMQSYAMPLFQGDVVNFVTFFTATTAAVSPANWWAAIYDDQATPALLAQGADQTSTALPAGTLISAPLGYTVTRTTIYRVALMFNCGTQPTLFQVNNGSSSFATKQLSFAQDKLYQTSGSGLTSAAPATITAGSVSTNVPMLICSSAI